MDEENKKMGSALSPRLTVRFPPQYNEASKYLNSDMIEVNAQ